MTTDPQLIEQPTATPTRKVAAGGITGAAVVVLLGILGALGVELPGVDPGTLPVTEALAVVVSWAAAWLTRERATPSR